MKFEAEDMACTNPAELSVESRFLLEMDGVKVSKKSFAYHDMIYWLSATRAAKKAGRRISSARRRAKKTMKKMRKSLGKGTKLYTKGVSEQIQKDFEAMNDFLCVDVRSSRVVW